MFPYQINEGNLQIPIAWQDQTLNIFRIPPNGSAKEASLLISRDASQGDASFDDFINGQIKQCEQQLSEFKLLQKQICAEPFSYAWVDYTWNAQEKTVMLRQIFFESKPANLIVTLTTTPEDAPTHEAAWREVVRSVQLKNLVVAGNVTKMF